MDANQDVIDLLSPVLDKINPLLIPRLERLLEVLDLADQYVPTDAIEADDAEEGRNAMQKSFTALLNRVKTDKEFATLFNALLFISGFYDY